MSAGYDWINGYLVNFGGTVPRPSTDCWSEPSGWYMYQGPQYNCIWFGEGNRCGQYGDSNANGGIVANAACCECGGGTTTPPAPTTPPPTRAPITPPPTPGPTICAGMSIKVELTTDNYPLETSWSFTSTCSGSGGQTYPGPSYSSAATTTSTEMCLPSGEYDFVIEDEWGDGICCGYGEGSYKIYVDGVVEHDKNGVFDSSETITIGSCVPPPPTTSSPSRAPTDPPTDSPVTSSPTNAPATSSPTTGADPLAQFDATIGAPKCATVGRACTSGDALLDGKDGNRELNPPNTIDSCNDGPYGSYHNDESVDMITVRTVDGGELQGGKQVEVEAKVWAWSTGSADAADFYYTANAASPDWELIGTAYPQQGGAITFPATYTLPASSDLQAVRVRMRYGGSEGPCNQSSWDDLDDLVFAVAPPAEGVASAAVGPREPPMVMSAPAKTLDADFCTSLEKDRCEGIDSCEWVNGRYKGCYAKGE